MENATKALIIAAAILIAIVLISLGVFVLGQGTTMVQENSDMSAEQVTAYNAEWEAYAGKATGTKVKQLINAVNQHNRNSDDASKKITITCSAITGSTDGTYASKTDTDGVKTGNSYTVKVTAHTTGGLVSTITIE